MSGRRNKEYKVIVNFVECVSGKDMIEREDKIISLLVKNAIKLCQKQVKNKESSLPIV